MRTDLRKLAADGLPRAYIDATKIRYLLAGGWNTLFGYVVGFILYYGFEDRMHVLLVGTFGYILSTTMAFVTYKLFVFRTKGNWLAEYFRIYLVYGFTAVIGIGVLWGLVDGLQLPFWFAQGLLIPITIVVSYFSHSRFTFGRSNNQ